MDNLPRYVANEAIDAASYAVCRKRSVRHGTKREVEKTTTQKDTEGPQVCTYCENHSQLMYCVTRDSFTSVLNRCKVSIFLCDYAANRSIF